MGKGAVVCRHRYEYDKADSLGIDFTGCKSMTVQADAESADVNSIMAKYEKYGVLPMSANGLRQPVYADVSEIGSFVDVQNRLLSARSMFDALPIKIRQRFNFDPAALLDFCADEKNREEAISLGLLKKPDLPQGKPDGAPAPNDGAKADAAATVTPT